MQKFDMRKVHLTPTRRDSARIDSKKRDDLNASNLLLKKRSLFIESRNFIPDQSTATSTLIKRLEDNSAFKSLPVNFNAELV